MRPRPFGRGNLCCRAWPPSQHRASMRPRPFGRGNSFGREYHREYFLASMRPRPFGRGNAHAEAPKNKVALASMRPRPFGRGNPMCLCGGTDTTRCFNEATAFRPWKLPAWRSLGPPGRGFNEATAFRPWKWRSRGRPWTGLRTASMRPRPFGRGNVWSRHRTVRTRSRFNEATAFRPWKCRRDRG